MLDRPQFAPIVADWMPDLVMSAPLHPSGNLSAREVIERLGDPDEMGRISGQIKVTGAGESRLETRAILMDATADVPEAAEHLQIIFALSADTADSDNDSITASEFIETLSELTEQGLKRGEYWECDLIGAVPERYGPIVSLPVRLWERSKTGLGQMIGARFELTQTGVKEGWIAFDQVDDHSTVQLHFIKVLPMNDALLPRIWSEASRILRRSIVPALERTDRDSPHD